MASPICVLCLLFTICFETFEEVDLNECHCMDGVSIVCHWLNVCILSSNAHNMWRFGRGSQCILSNLTNERMRCEIYIKISIQRNRNSLKSRVACAVYVCVSLTLAVAIACLYVETLKCFLEFPIIHILTFVTNGTRHTMCFSIMLILILIPLKGAMWLEMPWAPTFFLSAAAAAASVPALAGGRRYRAFIHILLERNFRAFFFSWFSSRKFRDNKEGEKKKEEKQIEWKAPPPTKKKKENKWNGIFEFFAFGEWELCVPAKFCAQHLFASKYMEKNHSILRTTKNHNKISPTTMVATHSHSHTYTHARTHRH